MKITELFRRRRPSRRMAQRQAAAIRARPPPPGTRSPTPRDARAPGREHEVKARLLGSLVLGAIAAAIVVVYEDTSNMRPWCAAAARRPPVGRVHPGGRVRRPDLFVAVVVFVVGTVVAGRRKARQRPRGARGRGAGAARRGRAGSWR